MFLVDATVARAAREERDERRRTVAGLFNQRSECYSGVDFSDQLNYWHAGYNAVMITDTAFYRNLNYHTAHDTPEKLDYKRMAMVVEGVYAAVTELSR